MFLLSIYLSWIDEIWWMWKLLFVWERKVVAASLQIQTFSLWYVFQYATVTSQNSDCLIIGYFVKPFIFSQPFSGELGEYARFSLWTGTHWCCCFYLHGVLKFSERGTFKAMNWGFFCCHPKSILCITGATLGTEKSWVSAAKIWIVNWFMLSNLIRVAHC